MHFRYFALVLALLLAMSACSVGSKQQTEPPASTNPTTQPVPETTVPTETVWEGTPADLMTEPPATVPPETYSISCNLEGEEWEPMGEEYPGTYWYVGEESSIPIGDLFTLNLPEEWAGNVLIRAVCSSKSLMVEVQSIPLLEAYRDMRGYDDSYLAIFDPVMAVYVYPKTLEGEPSYTDAEALTHCYETDEWTLSVETPGNRADRCNTALIEGATLMKHLGEEAYEEAKGGITCTQKEAEAMISLNP